MKNYSDGKSNRKNNGHGKKLDKLPIDHITKYEWELYCSNRTLGREYFCNGAFTSELTRIWGERAKDVLEESGVLVSRDFIHNEMYGVVFPQIDINGIVRNAKLVASDTNGDSLNPDEAFLSWDYRKKQYVDNPDMHRTYFVGKKIMRDYDFVTRQCFFNEHTLAKYPDKPVAIVKRERSAVVCTLWDSDFIWLGTGGKWGCRWHHPSVYEVLKGRAVTFYPDPEDEEDWTEKAGNLALAGINVSMCSLRDIEGITPEELENGFDIGDYCTRLHMQEHPEIVEKQREAPKPLPALGKASAMKTTAKQ